MLHRLKTALAGRYDVERELGAGGMATVYLAEDVKHHRPVAIKVLRPELAAALGGERFLREIEIAARLQHPHILPVHDSGEADGLLYYVMPFVEGESLAARIRREGGLPTDWSVRILREVADALSYAHHRGLIHRDIKPDNILLSGQHALIADFGIARAMHDAAGSSLTGTGMALGTPSYMAPEQASGESLDHRADIYALGVVAYEMLAGEPPFRGRTAQAIIGAHMSQPAAPVTQHRSGLPPALAALVMRCLEKHPADRPQTADEVVQLLDAAVVPSGGFATTAGVPSSHRPIDSSSHRLIVSSSPSTRRVAVIFAAASLVVLAAVYGLMIALGLPSWVFPAAVALLLVGLPIVLTTSRVEQNRTPTAVPHRFFNWRRAITGGAIAFGGLVLVVSLYMAMRSFGIGPVGTLVASGRLGEHAKVILADFSDRSGDSSLAAAVTDAFRVDLGQSKAVELVQSNAVKDALARMQREPAARLTEELAREIATREGIHAIVTGDINALGGGYVLSARILDAESGDVLVPLRETARDSTEIIPAVDRLSKKVRERIGESLRDIRATPALSQVTTSSLPALRKYTQGSRAIDAGDTDQGIALFKEAIALDSTFAASWRGLSVALGNVDLDRALQADAAEKAFRYRDRLPERERLWTVGSYYMKREQFDSSRAAYQALLGVDPDSPRVLNNLGVLESDLRRSEQALAWYERSLAAGPENPIANFNVVVTNLELGRVDQARAARARFDAVRPGHLFGIINASFIAWSTADYDSVAAASDRLAAKGVSSMDHLVTRSRLGLAGVRGQPSHMESLLAEAERRAATGGMAGEYLRVVAFVARYEAVVEGHPAAAIARMDAALAKYPLPGLQQADRPYAELAQSYARAEKPDRARQFLAEADPGARGMAKSEVGIAAAYATLAEGRAEQAVGEFRAADIGECVVCALPGLAHAMQAAGHEDSVVAVLERYLTTPDDERLLIDPLERAGALARLGELYEQRGDTVHAVERNAQFLALWKDADPMFRPVIERVRERQRRLTAEK